MNKALVRYALDDTVRAHRAHTRWLDWCKGLTNAIEAAGLYEAEDFNTEPWRERCIAVEQEYIAAHKRPPVPSKNRKHKMYGDAWRAATLAGLKPEAGSIQSMEDIADVIARVTEALEVAS